MHRFRRTRVGLAVTNAPPRRHTLSVAWKNHGAGAEAVLVFQFARQDVSNDLHVTMGMGWETAARRDPVLVDYAQGPEAHPLGIGVIAETESVARLQPAVVAAAAVAAGSYVDHNRIAPELLSLSRPLN